MIINTIYKKIVLGFIFFGSFFITTIPIILPWSVRRIYLSILHFFSKIILRFKFVLDLVNEFAFAEESDKELLRKIE